MLEENTPKMNKSIMTGLVVPYINNLDSYIDSILSSAARSLPKDIKYEGCKICTPFEEYLEETRPQNNKRSYDIAKSDLYLCKLLFSFKGELLPPKFIYLPFVREGGILTLRGSDFHVMPVLSDKVISIGITSIFVRLLRDKYVFKKCNHSFVVNNKTEITTVIWSQLHRYKSNKVPITTKALPTCLHYLLAKLGFNETMSKLLNFNFHIGESEINYINFPEANWVICESLKIRPKTFMGDNYIPSNIRIAIPKDKWDLRVKSIIGSLYYIIDHFPTKIPINSLVNQNNWLLLLGNIVFSGLYTNGKLYNDMMEHFESLKECVDDIIKKKLKELGMNVNSIDDLLMLMINNFNQWITDNEFNQNNVYGKYIEMQYDAGYGVTSGIFKFIFNINKLQKTKENKDKEITVKEVVEQLNKNIKKHAINKIKSNSLVATTVSYSGENMYAKITSILSEQPTLPGLNNRRQSRKVVDSSKKLHVSMLEIGSLFYLPKTNPTPIARLNPYSRIDPETGGILPVLYPEILKRTQKLLDGEKIDLNNT